jgi:hypothetical protein
MSFSADNQISVLLTLDAVLRGERPSIELLRSLLRQINKSETIIICPRVNLIGFGPLERGQAPGPKGIVESNGCS